MVVVCYKIYDENVNRESYDLGNVVAIVGLNITSHHQEEDVITGDGNILRLIDAEYEDKENFDSNTIFNISFSLEKIREKYGKGVYTVNTFYGNDETDILAATSKSIFID